MADTNDDSPFTQAIYEADIDWILTIELNCNASFRDWLGQTIFGFTPQHDRAWRSVSESSGESDLIWRVSDADGQYHLALIENKISAAAQPDQQKRYVIRGEEYVGRGYCDEFCTVLISPEHYSSPEAGDYDYRVSYEAILERYEAGTSEHDEYLSYVLTEALTKSRTAPPPDPETTEFRRKVWDLAEREFPQLRLSEPGPCRERWVMQSYPGFFVKYKMLWKGDGYVRSVVDIELPGQADNVDALDAEYGDELRELGGSVVKASKSAAFRIEVPCAHPPLFDLETTRTAMEAWDKLLTWWQATKQ